MNHDSTASLDSLSLARAVDRLCDEFESAWSAGKRPNLEEFLARSPASQWRSVLRELLAIELHHRRLASEPCFIVEYQQRIPQLTLDDWQAGLAASVEDGEVERSDAANSTIQLPSVCLPSPHRRYRILNIHARGGMGEVWLADDLEIGRRVAYKRIRPGRNQIQERFLAEAQITGQLEHPGIVPVHELGHDSEGGPYYVMRLVQGRNLKQVIAEAHEEMRRDSRSRELHWVKLLEVFLALCRTIAYAHHRGVIHRDIKPDNIMVGSHGETLVVDWGLAKLIDSPDISVSQRLSVRPSGTSGSTATQDGNVMGSPPYISPEMAEGRIAEGDEKTDIYLLGATLHEILCDQPPRQGSSQEEILELARTTPPRPPQQVNARVPPALNAICLRAMAREKQARYESAEEMAADVERFLAGDAVRAYAEPWTDQLARWIRRHRKTLGRATAACILSAISIGAVWAWQDAQRRATSLAARLDVEQRRQQARADQERFERLAEDLHYALSDTMPLDDRLSFTEPGMIERLRKEIDEITVRWNGFADIPEAGPRASLQRTLAELTLWRVQEDLSRPTTKNQVQTYLLELDRLVDSNPPLASYQRLRATCLLLVGQSDLAAEAMKLSRQSQLAAFDYFLQGERLRAEAISRSEQSGESSLWRSHRARLHEALGAYRKCLELDPTHFWARLQKGRCHLVCDEPDAALAELDLAAALRPQAPWAWSARGFVNAVLRKSSAAEHDLDHALQLEPKFVAARLHRSGLRLLNGDPAQAQQELADLASETPDNVQVRYYQALADFALRDHASALQRCSSILGDHPRLDAVRLLRARVNLNLDRIEEARADVEQWLLSRDANSESQATSSAARRCHVWRVLAYQVDGPVRRRALEQALHDGEEAIVAGRASVELCDDLAAVYLALNRPEQALARIETGLTCEGSPEAHAKLHLKRGLTLVSRPQPSADDLQAARDDYRKAGQLTGSEPTAQIIRAEAHAMLGYIAALRVQESEAQREVALSLSQLRGANHFTVWINLACVYNALADRQNGDAAALQEAALSMLACATDQARRVGQSAEATRTILGDPALKSLQRAPGFKEVLTLP